MGLETSLCIENPVKQFLMSYLFQTKLILKGEDKITVSIEMPRSFLELYNILGIKKTIQTSNSGTMHLHQK